MAQAKSLTESELQTLLDFVAHKPFSTRNRAMVLMTFWAGLREGELAQLRYGDVFDALGQAKPELRLDASITKGRQARTVFLAQKLRDELNLYEGSHPTRQAGHALFPTRKHAERGFTPNTCAQHFLTLYRQAGIANASSHSGRLL